MIWPFYTPNPKQVEPNNWHIISESTMETNEYVQWTMASVGQCEIVTLNENTSLIWGLNDLIQCWLQPIEQK